MRYFREFALFHVCPRNNDIFLNESSSSSSSSSSPSPSSSYSHLQPHLRPGSPKTKGVINKCNVTPQTSGNLQHGAQVVKILSLVLHRSPRNEPANVRLEHSSPIVSRISVSQMMRLIKHDTRPSHFVNTTSKLCIFIFIHSNCSICSDNDARLGKHFNRNVLFLVLFIRGMINERTMPSGLVNLGVPLVNKNRRDNNQRVAHNVGKKCANHDYGLTESHFIRQQTPSAARTAYFLSIDTPFNTFILVFLVFHVGVVQIRFHSQPRGIHSCFVCFVLCFVVSYYENVEKK